MTFWEAFVQDPPPEAAPPEPGPWKGPVEFLPGPYAGRSLAWYVEEVRCPGHLINTVEAAFERFADRVRAMGGNAVGNPNLTIEWKADGWIVASLSGYVIRLRD